MSGYSISYLIGLVDKFSRPARKVSASAQQISGSMKAAAGAVGLAQRAITGVGTAATHAAQRIKKLSYTMVALRRVQHGLMGGMMLGFGGGMVARTAVSTLLDYEKTMNEVRANMLDTIGGAPVIKGAKSLEQSVKLTKTLRKETMRIARVSKFSPTEVSKALLELARMGYDAQTAMKLLHPTVRMAGAAAMDAGTAVDYTTNIMTMFGKDANKAAQVVDKLAMAVANTNLTFSQLYEGLKYAGPSAFSAGVGMDETVAVLMTLAKAGQKASMGGTAFARLMEYSYQKTPKAAKALAAIGMSFKDLVDPKTGKHASMVDVLKKFAEAGQKFGRGKVIEAIQRLYKLRGGRAAKVLSDFDLIEDIEKNVRLLKLAKDRAKLIEKIMMSGVYGAAEKLRASLYELVISLGDAGLSNNLTWMADKLRAMANYVSNMSPFWKSLVANAATLVGVFSALVIPLGILAFALSALRPVISLLLSPFKALARIVLAFAGGLLAGLAPLARAIVLVNRYAGAAAALKFALYALMRLAAIGLAITLVWRGYENFDRIKQFLAKPHKFDIIFPEAPPWLKDWVAYNISGFTPEQRKMFDELRGAPPKLPPGVGKHWVKPGQKAAAQASKIMGRLPSGIEIPGPTPNPARIPQVQVKSQVQVDPVTFQPAQVQVQGTVDGSGLIRLQGTGAVQANRGRASASAGTDSGVDSRVAP